MTSQVITYPSPGEYGPYFENYLKHVSPDEAVVEGLESQIKELNDLLGNLTDERAAQVDAPYTWTPKQVLAHIIDTDLVFSYRARRIASGDETPLLGFEQDDVVNGASFDKVSMSSLLEEFAGFRMGFVHFCRRLTSEMANRKGQADGKPVSVRAIAFIQIGHVRHHQRILEQRLG